MMPMPGKRVRTYFEVIANILSACPDTKTTLYLRSGLTYPAFIGPRYLPLVLRQGLVRVEKKGPGTYTVQRGTDAYLLTPKGARYLELLKQIKELLGIGD